MTLLANEFVSKGYDTTMVLLRGRKPDTYVLDSRIKCVRFLYGTHNKVIIAVKRFYMLRSLLKSTHFDAVISFMHDINVMTLMSSWGLRLNIIVSERNDPSKRSTSPFYRWLEQKLYLTAKRIVFQTEQVRKMYPSGIRDISVVIPNPVNSGLPNKYLGSRDKIIVAAGRLVEQKNFTMLIRAFTKFHQVHPEYDLIIYGTGTLLKALKDEVMIQRVEGYVKFPGYVDDVNFKMRKAAMYISTSNFEGISNSMLEALAMGIPTICTNCPVGGAAMLIENHESGILIPVGDEVALYRNMLKIAENEEFANHISDNAVEICKKYSVEKVTALWMGLLNL
jgi:glycosyltransferase involved in cell wall biosynthesis